MVKKVNQRENKIVFNFKITMVNRNNNNFTS